MGHGILYGLMISSLENTELGKKRYPIIEEREVIDK